jgi:rod shape-determining protein MreD
LKTWFLGTTTFCLLLAEVTLGPTMALGNGAGPDLLLFLAIFVAVRAPWSVSPFYYFALGTASDLIAVPQPGLRGATYLLAALAIERFSPGRRRSNPVVCALLCAGAGFFIEIVFLLVSMRDWPAGLRGGLLVAFQSALLSGLAGLLLAWPANLWAKLLKWPPESRLFNRRQMMAAAASGTLHNSRSPKE